MSDSTQHLIIKADPFLMTDPETSNCQAPHNKVWFMETLSRQCFPRKIDVMVNENLSGK